MIKPRVFVPCLAAVLALSSGAAPAQSADPLQERVAASFILALGRTPAPAELATWTAQGAASVADLVERHRKRLADDAAVQRAVAEKAAQDALGLTPADAGLGVKGADTYTDLVRRHLARLSERPADYEAVMHRAYRLLLDRDAYSEEIDYWKRQPTLSFALLVACIDNWARRNQPGLMVTTGVAAVTVNSPYLDTVRLSPAVAAEARAAADLGRPDDPALATAVGRHVMAPGGARLVSVGGIFFAAAGTAALAPASKD